MNKRIWMLMWAVVLLMSWAGSAAATNMWTPYGQDITISDQNSATNRDWYTDREDDEVEPGMIHTQAWDLEAMFVNDAYMLSLVGGYDFMNGVVVGGRRYASGDIFVDVDGDAVYGDFHGEGGNNTVTDTFGYDYVYQLTFGQDGGFYQVFALNGQSETITSYESQNQGSNPWRFAGADHGEEMVGEGDFTYKDITPDENLIGALGVQGDEHFVISGFDLNLIPAGFEEINLHFTMECGNDNLMGQVAPVPEPATMVLLGTGLIGLAAFSRRRNRKSA